MQPLKNMILPIDINAFPRKTGVYIVGGSIRDLLCGRTPIDYDLALTDTPEIFARLLAARISGHVVEFGRHGHTIRRVVTGNYHFDIMPLNGVSIEDDLRRRDFTINAMALEVSSGNLLDPTGGRQDLAAKKIRMVSRDVFRNDPVRLVRAYRMAATFDFTIDSDTQAAIFQDADLIGKSAGERIREELFKIFKSAGSHAQLERMAHSGLLFSVFPELAQLKNCHPGNESQHDLFEQTLAAYDHLEKLLYSRDQKLPEPANRHVKNIGTARAILLKWAVLLQSIGQPSARTEADADIHHCDAHAARSATMAGAICRRLRFSRRQSDTIEFLVRRQIEPFLCFKARQKKVPVDRALIRLFMECGDRTPDILLHALAGIMGRKAREDPSIKRFYEFVSQGIDCYYSTLRPRTSTPPPLNGNDLVKNFGLKPSPKFKQILNAIEEEHLASQNLTREQALDLVEKLLNDRRKKVLPIRKTGPNSKNNYR
jgi:tRNA nucleotidyltransferase/poly(A) polymerase